MEHSPTEVCQDSWIRPISRKAERESSLPQRWLFLSVVRFLPGIYPLYFVTDHDLNGGRSKLDVIRSALEGGVKLIQYRDKHLSDSDFEREARLALESCRKHGATMIVDDRVAVARHIGADGVHLGQEDMSPIEARRILGSQAIIGFSTHDEAEVVAAEHLPVNYINIGPMFPTRTKEHLHSLGLKEVLRLAHLSSHPWTTMGGIKRAHLQELFKRGARTVAMVTEISLAEDVEKRVKELLDAMN
jgi:thiamine-phosphate pyrophosphorylase